MATFTKRMDMYAYLKINTIRFREYAEMGLYEDKDVKLYTDDEIAHILNEINRMRIVNREAHNKKIAEAMLERNRLKSLGLYKRPKCKDIDGSHYIKQLQDRLNETGGADGIYSHYVKHT